MYKKSPFHLSMT